MEENGGRKASAGLEYVSVRFSDDEVVVSVCDEEVLGKVLVDPEKDIKYVVDPFFYKGELKSVEEALEILTTATTGNLVGERIVKAAVEKGLIHPDAVLVVQGVPIAFFAIM
uniref:DUF424 family protein n=1 Tax=Thermosphaera aggregans TaxID=54254 RepID=A0A7C2BKD2_9CREN